MNLRQYQLDAVDSTLRKLHSRPILVGPTGSGKTVMGVELCRRLKTKVLWVAARRELIKQARKQLQRVTMERIGTIMAGEEELPDANYHVASVQTLANRSIPDGIGLIIIDECHHATATQYAPLLDADIPVIGMTATPFRLDGRPLADCFGEIVVSAKTRHLCGLGYLIEPIVYASPIPNMQTVNFNAAGDFSMSDIEKIFQKADLVGDIVREWLHKADTLRTLCSAINIKHSQSIVKAFRNEEIPAEHIDGSTPVKERDAAIKRLQRGETLVLSQCDLLTEGFDMPELQCLIMARPTASLNLHLQLLGRIMRTAKDKSFAIVLDHAGNHHRHGTAVRDLDYSLTESQPIGRRNANIVEQHGLRTCRNCFALFDATDNICPLCAYVNVPVEREITNEHGELVELDENSHEYQNAFWQECEDLRFANGNKPGWASYRFKERFGKWPDLLDDVAFRELINPDNADREYRRRVFRCFLERARVNEHKDGKAKHDYKRIFGVWPKGFVQSVCDEDDMPPAVEQRESFIVPKSPPPQQELLF